MTDFFDQPPEIFSEVQPGEPLQPFYAVEARKFSTVITAAELDAMDPTGWGQAFSIPCDDLLRKMEGNIRYMRRKVRKLPRHRRTRRW